MSSAISCHSVHQLLSLQHALLTLVPKNPLEQSHAQPLLDTVNAIKTQILFLQSSSHPDYLNASLDYLNIDFPPYSPDKIRSICTNTLQGLSYIETPLNVLTDSSLQSFVKRPAFFPPATKRFIWSTFCGQELQPDKQINKGSFATIHLLRFQKKHYALKQASATNSALNSVKLWRKELCVYTMLRHPHIVSLQAANDRFLFLPKIRGKDLDIYIRKDNQPFTSKTIHSILMQVAKALSYIHSLGYIHKDVKADNVFYDLKSNRAYLGDFGLVAVSDDPPSNIDDGPLRSSAPELLINLRKPPEPIQLSDKCDVWSFGYLVHFLITRTYHLFLQFINNRVTLTSALQFEYRYTHKTSCTLEFFEPHEYTLRETDPNGTLQIIVLQCFHGDPDKRPSMQDIVSQFEQLSL